MYLVRYFEEGKFRSGWKLDFSSSYKKNWSLLCTHWVPGCCYPDAHRQSVGLRNEPTCWEFSTGIRSLKQCCWLLAR